MKLLIHYIKINRHPDYEYGKNSLEIDLVHFFNLRNIITRNSVSYDKGPHPLLKYLPMRVPWQKSISYSEEEGRGQDFKCSLSFALKKKEPLQESPLSEPTEIETPKTNPTQSEPTEEETSPQISEAEIAHLKNEITQYPKRLQQGGSRITKR